MPFERAKAATADDFRAALQHRLAAAEAAGHDHIEIRSGDLHREMGDYPGPRHRLGVCCNVMRAFRLEGDDILHTPECGSGASLVIRYRLPRTGARIKRVRFRL